VLTKRGRPVDVTSGTLQSTGVHRTGITLRAAKAGKFDVPGFPYQIVLEERCSCA
jgi:hypothetical protein